MNNQKEHWCSLFSLPSSILTLTFTQAERTGVAHTTLKDATHPELSIKVPSIVDIETHHSLETMKEKLSNMLIILCQGGYFSGGYYQQGECVVHKSFHRVISKKQNEKKSQKDKAYNYDKHKHMEEIDGLLGKWSDHVSNATVIFLHSPSKNSSFVMTSEGKTAKHMNLLHHDDARLSTLPFSCARPSHAELTKIFKQLTMICVMTQNSPIPQ